MGNYYVIILQDDQPRLALCDLCTGHTFLSTEVCIADSYPYYYLPLEANSVCISKNQVTEASLLYK